MNKIKLLDIIFNQDHHRNVKGGALILRIIGSYTCPETVNGGTSVLLINYPSFNESCWIVDSKECLNE